MLGYRKFNIVIMDGSSKWVNREIAGIVDMATDRKIGKTRPRPLDQSHPTMKVISRITTYDKFREACKIIENTYPGLCVFKVAL